MIAENKKIIEGLSHFFERVIHADEMANKLEKVLWEYILYKIGDTEIGSNKTDADNVYWLHELCAVLKGHAIA